MTRDGIAYIHDQSVRWMNKGLTPDELVEKVKLPPHLAGYAIRVDREDKLARDIKARSLRKLGYASMNINWRNWYLMSAMELEGKLDGDAIRQRLVEMRKVFLSPDMVHSFTPQSFLQNWVTRIDPERAGDVEMALGFSFPDVDEQWMLEVRRGVAQLHKGIPEGPLCA